LEHWFWLKLGLRKGCWKWLIWLVLLKNYVSFFGRGWLLVEWWLYWLFVQKWMIVVTGLEIFIVRILNLLV